jgi:hypothetical protein
MKVAAFGLALLLVTVLPAAMQASCAGNAQVAIVQPYIPPSYYNCSVTTPATLCHAYYGRYNNIATAEEEFNNQVFVFKDLTITDTELKYATNDYLWLEGIIQCYFLTKGSASNLKIGEKVDVVGINTGQSKDYKNLLVFTGCIFLPAGSAQLPAGGNSALTITGY